MSVNKIRAVIGLKTATKQEIKDLLKEYPFAVHVTEYSDGTKLPYNGVIKVFRV